MAGGQLSQEGALTYIVEIWGVQVHDNRRTTFIGVALVSHRSFEENKYSPDIVINIVFWLANTDLIDDVEAFHRVKSYFAEFRTRMGVLLSLKDFIDKFGANTNRIQQEIGPLQVMYSRTADRYLEHSFLESEEIMSSGLMEFPKVEEVASKEKNRALLWVCMIEWLVSSSTLFISGFILWTLMVRRRLYKTVRTTKPRAAEG